MSAARPSTVELLDRLVAFDTTSRNPNLELMAFVRGFLDSHGVRSHASHDPTGQKINLHALIGPAIEGGVALSGHVDTVPVDGQRWQTDPFDLRAKDGKLFGRGTCDMKGFVASMLAAVPDLVARRLARPVHLFITFDEETTMAGARRLLATLDEAGWPRPAMCVVGEPSLMQPIVGHKGRLAARAVVRGRPGHSSDPARGVNAIHAAARLIAWIAGEADRTAREGPFAEGFEPAHTTSQVGTVEGGAALNIVPERCELTVEWRPIPGDDARDALRRLEAHALEVLEPAMRSAAPGSGFGFEVTDWVPEMSLPPDHELAALVRRAAGSNGAGHVSYATEGGLFQEAGIPTIVCGPGSIEQAHGADEWIERAQLDASDAFIRRLVEPMAA